MITPLENRVDYTFGFPPMLGTIPTIRCLRSEAVPEAVVRLISWIQYGQDAAVTR